jgi:hypothetical protein
MAKGDVNWLLVAGIVVVGYFLLVGNPFAAEADDTPAVQGSQGGCNVEDISLSPKMTRMGKAGTSLSTAANNYYILTDGLGSVAGATATTVPTNYDVQVMFIENSTTYYTVVKEFNTDCQDPKFVAVEIPMADTSLNSLYCKNSDGTVNSAANAEAMGADDVFETTCFLKAGSDTYWGNPTSDCENVIVLQYDKTYILKAEGDEPTPVPGAFTYKNATYDGSNAFIAPKSGDSEEVSFNVKLTATSTDPATTGGAHPNMDLFDCNIDKDEDTLELIEGVEDEDLNSLALNSEELYIYYS